MPNPKVGTVTPDVASAVKNAKSGQVRYRADKAGIIHCSVGTVSFEVPALKENINGLIADLVKAKPAAAQRRLPEKDCSVLDHGSWPRDRPDQPVRRLVTEFDGVFYPEDDLTAECSVSSKTAGVS